MRNPHLRAKLAETLEALVPIQRSQNSSGLLSPSAVNMVRKVIMLGFFPFYALSKPTILYAAVMVKVSIL